MTINAKNISSSNNMTTRSTVICCILFASATICYVRCATSQKSTINLSTIINSPVNCSRHKEILEECSLLQGYSFLNSEFGWPRDQAALTASCKRNTDAIRCFRLYSKCLTKVQKSVAVAVLGTRTKFVKRVCSDKPNEQTTTLLEASKCMYKNRLPACKAAERKSIMMAESILSRGDSFKNLTANIQIKYACCTMAFAKKEFIDALKPECSKFDETMDKFVDSNLGDASGSLCPDLDAPKTLEDCKKLQRFPESAPKSKFYMMPILEVSNFF